MIRGDERSCVGPILIFIVQYLLQMDFSSPNTYIEAVPGCHLPFHWPRLDKEQELCIRLPDIDGCMWSGAVPIHETQSLYVNIR